jgi:hypothetical protein
VRFFALLGATLAKNGLSSACFSANRFEDFDEAEAFTAAVWRSVSSRLDEQLL